jgi:hypothetical protein
MAVIAFTITRGMPIAWLRLSAATQIAAWPSNAARARIRSRDDMAAAAEMTKV